jgi:hypothetical protein
LALEESSLAGHLSLMDGMGVRLDSFGNAETRLVGLWP